MFFRGATFFAVLPSNPLRLASQVTTKPFGLSGAVTQDGRVGAAFPRGPEGSEVRREMRATQVAPTVTHDPCHPEGEARRILSPGSVQKILRRSRECASIKTKDSSKGKNKHDFRETSGNTVAKVRKFCYNEEKANCGFFRTEGSQYGKENERRAAGSAIG